MTTTLQDIYLKAYRYKATMEKAVSILATSDDLMASGDPELEIAQEYVRKLGCILEVLKLIIKGKGELDKAALEAISGPVDAAGRHLEDEDMLRYIEQAGRTLDEVPY